MPTRWPINLTTDQNKPIESVNKYTQKYKPSTLATSTQTATDTKTTPHSSSSSTSTSTSTTTQTTTTTKTTSTVNAQAAPTQQHLLHPNDDSHEDSIETTINDLSSPADTNDISDESPNESKRYTLSAAKTAGMLCILLNIQCSPYVDARVWH